MHLQAMSTSFGWEAGMVQCNRQTDRHTIARPCIAYRSRMLIKVDR